MSPSNYVKKVNPDEHKKKKELDVKEKVNRFRANFKNII
jgi:hypothetical protein